MGARRKFGSDGSPRAGRAVCGRRCRWNHLAFAAAALLAAAAGPTSGQVPGAAGGEQVLGSFRWRGLGPNRGGRSIAVAGSMARPNEYYFGAVGGGLWKSTDGGTTWDPVTDGALTSSSVGAVAVCEADPDVVYLGTGEVQFRGTMGAGDGVYASRNGGRDWTHVGLAAETGQQAISRIRVHPTDCRTVYAAVLGDPYGPNQTRGVFRSRDGGGTWERVLFRNDHTGAADLFLDPSDPRVIYATLWDVRRSPWGAETGTDSGIFKSTDGGDTWRELTHNPGLPTSRIGKVGITLSAARPRRVYTVIEADLKESAGVFRSDDGGATWIRTSGHHGLNSRAEYYTRIHADPKNADRIYVLVDDILRSDDGGYTYQDVPGTHGDHHEIWIAADNPDRMINANDGGASVSLNGGRTWTELDYPTAQMYHVMTTSDFPYHVCGAQQDNTTACVPSDGDGSYWYHVAGGESGYIAEDPADKGVFYAGSYRGLLTRYDRETGQAQNVQVWPVNSMGESAGAQRERFQWTFPIVVSPTDPNVLYASSQHVWRSRNGGSSWERISPDLTRAEPHTISGEKLLVRNENSQDHYATVFALAPSPWDGAVLWAGSDDGLVQVTVDGGRSWQNVTPPALPEFARISIIEASPHARGTAYVAAERYKLQDLRPYLFKTEDLGRTWTSITQGIAPNHYLRAVREDPKRPGLLFAGTEHAPYVSFDGGAHWSNLALGLPDVQVSDLTVRGGDLIIATYGRGFYILDGAAHVMRHMTDEAFGGAHLFHPGDVVLTRARPTFGDGGSRARIPGANVAEVRYWLPRAAREVRIDIMDASGRSVRTFRGAEGEAEVRMIRDSLGFVINGPGWGQESPVRVPRGAGANVVAWNLRDAPAPTEPGMLFRGGASSLGPLVPPGTYRVRLTVDGAAQEQDFEIVPDPRLGRDAAAAMLARYQVARGIHDRVTEATSAILEIRSARREVADRTGRTRRDDVRRAAAGVVVRLDSLEERLYPVAVRSPDGPLHFGGRLANKIATVQHNAVESADAAPTRQSVEALEFLGLQLDAVLDELSRVFAEDVERLNTLLRAEGLPPVQTRRPRVIS